MQVAIDGPASAGKSTVAKIVAKELGFTYIDTGAMYRAVTLLALDDNISVNDTENLVKLAKQVKIEFFWQENEQHILINGEDRTKDIRLPNVAANVSAVSAVAGVRSIMVKLQRELAGESDVVMDGRDIGTTVLPNADLKIFLIASVSSRAQRRLLDFKKQGIEVDINQLEKDIASRDFKDSHREISPLKEAPDAVEIDSTDMSIEEVVSGIISLVKKNQEKSY